MGFFNRPCASTKGGVGPGPAMRAAGKSLNWRTWVVTVVGTDANNNTLVEMQTDNAGMEVPGQ